MNGRTDPITKSDVRNYRCGEMIAATYINGAEALRNSSLPQAHRCGYNRRMKIPTRIAAAFAATVVITPSSAFADIKAQGDNGFNVVHVAVIDAPPEVIWKRLITPKEYWSKTHSWSGSVDGFTLDPRAGGCFCELIQEKDAKNKMKTIGSVEHMRVIFAQPSKVLRMQGALGPLQSEAMLGTLTVAINPGKDGRGTLVSFSYVAGGYMRYKVSDIAAATDKVIGEQFEGLIRPYSVTETIPGSAADWPVDVSGILDDGAAKVSEPATVIEPAPILRNPSAVKPTAKKAAKPKTGGTKPKPKLPPAKPLDDMSR